MSRAGSPLGAAPFQGVVDPEFAAVGDAFRANFAPRDEGVSNLGAALTVIAGGRVVVDCRGGWRDLAGTQPWARDTIVNAYSVGKPVAAVFALTHVASGELALDGALTGFYAALLPGAPEPLLPAELLGEATSTQAQGNDLGLGFGLHQEIRRVGVTPSAFGHYGPRGTLGFGDPDARIGFCYLLSRTGDRWQDHRTKAILEALTTCC